jgi:glycosyltransferase involved in cell wall biosynthesis
MKISVAIPTFNSAAVIQATLESVLRQTEPPHEILVLDDGSTDNTVEILKRYEPRITILQQANRGVAPARNALAKRATGDLIAYLDHDDLWHPIYLAIQRQLFETHPKAVAAFTGHVNFHGLKDRAWTPSPPFAPESVELLEPLEFLRRYNTTTGFFGSMSFCTVPKKVLTEMGDEPFRVSGVDDSYLCTVLPLIGPVVWAPVPLAAYRFTETAQSANRVKSLGLWVKVFELLADRYTKLDDAQMRQAFSCAFSAKRRRYAKLLMGAGQVLEARQQLRSALREPGDEISRFKSCAWLASTHLPRALQPAWPLGDRASEIPGYAREQQQSV